MAQVGVSAHAADESPEGRGVCPRELGDDVGGGRFLWRLPQYLGYLLSKTLKFEAFLVNYIE
jgi:hypothetical protein